MTRSSAGCYVQQIVTAVPPRCLQQHETAALLQGANINARSTRLVQRLTRLTGIDKRHLAALDFQSALDDEVGIYRPSCRQPAGPGMGARSALFDAAAEPLVRDVVRGFRPQSLLTNVEALVTVSCTHASSPGLERAVFAHSAVPRCVQRWNLGFMGCSAALAAMRLAFQTTPRVRSTLIVACELSSLHFQYTDHVDQMTANLLFSDGAAATILCVSPTAVRVLDCRCAALPEAADQMRWFAGDHGLELRLSPELPDTLGQAVPEMVTDFLRPHGLRTSDVKHWIVHPGGPQILDRIALALDLPAQALDLSRSILRNFGNMSSPTILFIMKSLFEQRADGLALALAFGPGLTIEMVLLDLEHSRTPAGFVDAV